MHRISWGHAVSGNRCFTSVIQAMNVVPQRLMVSYIDIMSVICIMMRL